MDPLFTKHKITTRKYFCMLFFYTSKRNDLLFIGYEKSAMLFGGGGGGLKFEANQFLGTEKPFGIRIPIQDFLECHPPPSRVLKIEDITNRNQ